MTLAASVGYQPFGPANALDYGNGVVLSLAFDLDGRLAAIDAHAGPAPILDLDHGFDLAGNIARVTDNAGTMSWDYGYDALHRLVHGDHILPGNLTDEESYAYDAAGNRTERIVTKGKLVVTDTLSYGAASNRLESVSVFTPRVGKIKPSTVVRTLGYSDSGNTASDDHGGGAAWTLDYDSTDRLVSVADGLGALGAYVHNARGQRVSKTAGGVTTHYLYDLGGNMIAEADGGTGAALAEYIWLAGSPLAFVTGGAAYRVHTDHLNTPAKLTDAAGSVVWTGNFRPFGEPDTGTGGAVAFKLRFPGQYADDETGLHYNYFRDYDAGTGRYMQSDPIGLQGGWNTYGYVYSNPIRYTDPTGLDALCRAAVTCTGVIMGMSMGVQVGCEVGAGTGALFGTIFEPGGGTAVGGLGGCGIGVLLGGIGGGIAGGMAGNAAADQICEDEDEDECEKLYKIDTETCNGITRMRGKRAGARCHNTAMERYAACLAGKPIPPLDTWNN